MPTRRHKPHGHGLAGWFHHQIYNTSLLWLIGVLMLGAGFYWQTTYKLDQHSGALHELKNKAEENKKEETQERNKVRDQFLQDSKATAAGIAELNKQTAVMNAALSGLVRELEKIGTKLEAPARGR